MEMTLEEKIEFAKAHPEQPDFSINEKQKELFYGALAAATGSSGRRVIAYGGGMRSGKTYGMLAMLTVLCRAYPGSRWVVVTETYGYAKNNTFKELLKIVGSFRQWTINHSELSATYENGSAIEMRSEDHTTYPTQTNFDGLSCSGMLLEECQNLSLAMFEKARQRIGSLRLKKEPKPLLFMTFNPCSNWVKKTVYEPWVKNVLPEDMLFINALPADNPTNTREQMESWKMGDPREYRRYVEGDWSDMDADSRWAHAFDRGRHLGETALDTSLDVLLSFDFNRNPMSCVVAQHDEIAHQLRVIEAIKLPNSDIYKICDYIKKNYPGQFFRVTGDASGRNSSALVADGLNYYVVIKERLDLSRSQFVIPRSNPRLSDNQHMVNALLSNYDVRMDPVKAASLIWDMENVKMNPDGTIVKLDRTDASQQADLLDSFRYLCNAFMRQHVREINNTH